MRTRGKRTKHLVYNYHRQAISSPKGLHQDTHKSENQESVIYSNVRIPLFTPRHYFKNEKRGDLFIRSTESKHSPWPISTSRENVSLEHNVLLKAFAKPPMRTYEVMIAMKRILIKGIKKMNTDKTNKKRLIYCPGSDR